jgi:hypothetical protein
MIDRHGPVLRLLVLWYGLAACTVVVPSPTPTNGIADTPAPTATVVPQATPNGTISIGCFLATQSVISDFLHIAGQLHAFPASEQKRVLERLAGGTQETVRNAPAGCFASARLEALQALWDYISVTPEPDLTNARIEELILATGLPYPTFTP